MIKSSNLWATHHKCHSYVNRGPPMIYRRSGRDMGRFALHHTDPGGHWRLRLLRGGLPWLDRLLVLRTLLSDAGRMSMGG